MQKTFYIMLISFLLVGCSKTTPNGYITSGDVSIAYLKSMADSRSSRIKQDIWIEGTVVLNDKQAEGHKSFVIYDGTGGIEIKVDLDKLNQVIHLFSSVRVRCEGLYLGREGECIVLGTKPTGEYTVDRIPEGEIYNYLEMNITNILIHPPKTVDIAFVDYANMLDYVSIDGVWIVDEHRNMTWGDSDADKRPYDSSLRYFTDGCDTLIVATSNQSHFVTEHIPSETATLFGIIDSYERMPVLRINTLPVTE